MTLSLILILVSLDANAGRRSLRIDFANWLDAEPLGSAACPGSNPHSESVSWRGFLFSGGFAGNFLVDTYCQAANDYDPISDPDPSEYLSADSIPGDEAGLAEKVGNNNDPDPLQRVTALRYTFLDADRFPDLPGDPEPRGFQWAFYFFPGDVTLVALYGDLEPGTLGFEPLIEAGTTTLWDGIAFGSDGEYFCFEGTRFRGIWDGEPAGTAPLDGCILDLPEEIFIDGFEAVIE